MKVFSFPTHSKSKLTTTLYTINLLTFFFFFFFSREVFLFFSGFDNTNGWISSAEEKKTTCLVKVVFPSLNTLNVTVIFKMV